MPATYKGYTIPQDTDIADAPEAFTAFADSVPFDEYINVVSVSTSTGVTNDNNGKMLNATADLTLSFSNTFDEGFSVAAVADSGVTITYSGVEKDDPADPDPTTDQYEIATVVVVNGKKIFSKAGAPSPCPPCPPCPPAGAGEATISAITGSGRITTDGDSTVIEWLDNGTVTVSDMGLIPKALIVGAGGGSGGSSSAQGGGGGGGSGAVLSLPKYYVEAGSVTVTVGSGGSPGGAGGGGNGSGSFFGTVYAAFGGGGSSGISGSSAVGQDGASGGGGGWTGGNGNGIPGLGFDGDYIPSSAQGGGGGGSGGAPEGSVAGVGTSSSITGSAVIYAAGGIGGTGAQITPTLPNTGNGSDATYAVSSPYAGGSGIVILRLLTSNTAGMDTSGFTIVTAAMLAEQEAQRQAESEARQAEAVAAAELAEAEKAEKKAARKSKANELKESKEGDSV